jgi:hypothetical protein
MKLTGNLTRQQECVNRTIEWLHQVWDVTERGRTLQPDPFYARNALLTPEVIKNVIENIEGIFKSELARYPDYHRRAQGISANEYLIPPGFDHMTGAQQLAIVQGIDRIFQEYKDEGLPPMPESGQKAA